MTATRMYSLLVGRQQVLPCPLQQLQLIQRSQRPALLQPVAALEAVPAAQQPTLLQPVAVLTTAPAGQRFAAVEGQSQRCAQPFAQPAAVQGSTKLEAGNLVLQHST